MKFFQILGIGVFVVLVAGFALWLAEPRIEQFLESQGIDYSAKTFDKTKILDTSQSQNNSHNVSSRDDSVVCRKVYGKETVQKRRVDGGIVTRIKRPWRRVCE